jgi:tryptophan synthase beta subunit
MQLGKRLPRSTAIVVGLSGRGDKDVQVVQRALGQETT